MKNTGLRSLWIVSVLLLLVLTGLVPGAARAAARVRWSRPTRIDDRAPFAVRDALAGVSCPTASVCVATAAGGWLVVTTGVGGSHERSRRFDVDTARNTLASTVMPGRAELIAVSCPTVTRCYATDNAGGVVTFQDPRRGTARWHRAVIDTAAIAAISCPTVSVCVVADRQGDVVRSRDAGGPASAWHATSVDVAQRGFGRSLTSVSCPSTRLCVALDQTGSVASSRDPAAAKPSWRFTHLVDDGESFPSAAGPEGGIACPSVSLCVIASGLDVVSSTDPTGGAAAWSAAQIVPIPNSLIAISCPTTSGCVAVDDTGSAFASVDPAGGARTWVQHTIVPGPSKPQPSGVGCTRLGVCFVVDTAGGGFTASTPLTAWTARTLEPGYNALGGVICPTATVCFAWDNSGNVLRSRAGGAPKSWKVARVDGTNPILGLVCPSASLCVGYDGQHRLISSADPAGGAAGWQLATVDPTHTINSLACPSVKLCVAVDDAGNVLTSTDPSAGPTTWTTTYLGDVPPANECGANADQEHGPVCVASLSGLTCGSAAFCAAVDENGNVIASDDPSSGASAWRIVASVPLGEPFFSMLQCATSAFCVGNGGGNGNMFDSTSPGTLGSWHQTSGSPAEITSDSCPSESLCASTTFLGKVAVTTDPTAAAPHWTSRQLVAPQTEQSLPVALSVTCPRTTICLTLAADGRVFSTTAPAARPVTWGKALPDPASTLSDVIACPAAHRCLAVDDRGDLITEQLPAARRRTRSMPSGAQALTLRLTS